MKTGSNHLIATKDGPVGRLTFDNPNRLNAVSLEMWRAIPNVLAEFESDADIRAVSISGAGEKAFIAGADISQFEGLRSSSEDRLLYDQAAGKAIAAISGFSKPTIAMIRGYCIGAGVAVALSCDIRVCANDARFAIPAAKLGLAYPYENVTSLVELIGPAAAMQLLFTARQFEAEWALRVGLVSEVCAPRELVSSVQVYLDEISSNAPLSVRASKLAVREALKDPDKRAIEQVQEAVERCFRSADYVEGRRAYMGRRPAIFEGQ